MSDPSDVEDHAPPALLHPSLEDFDGTDLEMPIEGSVAADCHEYAQRFGEASRIAGQEGRVSEQRVYAMLCSLTGLHFKPEQVDAFGPMMTMGDQRTAIPDDFRGAPIDGLIRSVPKLRNTALRARLADVAWTISRNKAMATTAWSSYLQLIDELLKGDASPLHGHLEFAIMEATQFLSRALRIAQQTNGRQNALPTALADTHKLILAHKDLNGSPVWAVKLVSLGAAYGLIEPADAVGELEKLRHQLGSGAEPHTVRHILHEIASLYAREGDLDSANEFKRQAAEELVRLADAQTGSGMLASHWLMDAIKELSRIPNTRERRDELRIALKKAQEDSLGEMSPIGHEMDITELVDDAISRLEGISLAQSFGVFASMLQPRRLSDLEEQAKQTLRDFPLSSMFPSSQIDGEGRVVAKSPGGGLKPDEAQAQLAGIIARNDGIYRHLCVSGTLEPARQSLQARFGPTAVDIAPIVSRSAFVPPDAEPAYILGIQALLVGDFISSTHILVPHLEESLRYVLNQHGVVTHNILPDNVQEDQGLPALLSKHKEVLDRLFGGDLIAEMSRIFVDDLGPKIRHSVAHGKAAAYCCSADYIYGCWFIYRIVCLPLFPVWKDLEDVIGLNRPAYFT